MPDINFQSGAAVDTRSEEKKLKDFNIQEIVAAVNAVNWVEKPKDQWRRFPDQDQDGSGSCVAQTVKKIALVLLWLKEKTFETFSATFIYQQRSNKPDSGMMGVEAFELWRTKGITLENLLSSEKMNDAQMDALPIEQYEKDIALIFKVSNHIGIPNGDFETVASVIQTTGKAVMTWFYFTAAEWSQEIPTVIDPNLTIQGGLRHSVAAVDFFLFGGKKYLLIEDSAHFAGLTYHLISEEFFKVRNWFARYPMTFKFDEKAILEPKPAYHFSRVLVFGETSEDVKALQNILKHEGYFPANTDSTGYYGAITAKAVYDWQKNHAVAALSELDALQGRRVGEKTIAALNQIYGQ